MKTRLITADDELQAELLESPVIAWQLALFYAEVAKPFGEVYANTPRGIGQLLAARAEALKLKRRKRRRYRLLIVPAAVPKSLPVEVLA